jgi:hypothetical protein
MQEANQSRFFKHEDCDRRILAVTQWRDWCMAQLSELSLDGRDDDARALTAEHLELLEQVETTRVLWMIVEPDQD